MRGALTVVTALGVVLQAPALGAPIPLATSVADFMQPGTQPDPALDDFIPASICQGCHGGYLVTDDEAHDSWVVSLMAQSTRDPVFRAALAIANADAVGSGETCIRCHAPVDRAEPRIGTVTRKLRQLLAKLTRTLEGLAARAQRATRERRPERRISEECAATIATVVADELAVLETAGRDL